jgi:hypothetical protein
MPVRSRVGIEVTGSCEGEVCSYGVTLQQIFKAIRKRVYR